MENLLLDNVTLRVERALDFVARNLPCSGGVLETQARLGPTPPGELHGPREAGPVPEGVEHVPAYLNVTRAAGVTLRNVRVVLPEGEGELEGIALDDVQDAVLDRCVVAAAGGGEALPVAVSSTCRDVTVDGRHTAGRSSRPGRKEPAELATASV